LATTDRFLLEQARQYDVRALAEIYDRYAQPIYRYLYRYLGDATHAEDLTSEVFLKLLQTLNTPRQPRDQLQGWLYRVARNLAMDWFRHQGKAATVSLDEELVADGDLPLASLEKQQAQQQLRQALSQLTPDQQQVIILRFAQGLSIAHIGQLMEKSEGAIKLLQHRAINRLKRLLQRQEKFDEKKRGRAIRRVSAASNAGPTGRGTPGSSGANGQASVGSRRATAATTSGLGARPAAPPGRSGPASDQED
jgi:RNA polymerase sigma-70 factor (ECF subfamily)